MSARPMALGGTLTRDALEKYMRLNGEWVNAFAAGNDAEMRRLMREMAKVLK